MILLAAIANEPTGWSGTMNTFGLLGLAIMQAAGMWSDRRHREQNQKVLTGVRIDLGENTKEIKSVKRSVDGPMGQALQTAATALSIAAKATPGDSNLILQAIAAQKVSDDHKANMAAVEEESRKDVLMKNKIISEWKASQNPPIP